jgi:hypothetical protein
MLVLCGSFGLEAMTKRFERTGLDWLARQYLKRCKLELARQASLSDIQTNDIYTEAVSIWRAAIDSSVDPKTRILYAFCSLALSMFRVVSLKASREIAFGVTSRSVAATLSFPTKVFIRIYLWRWRQPVEMLKSWGPAKHLEEALGSTMRFEEEVRSDGIDLIVSKCGFRDFFARYDETALTKVMCSFDHVWMDLMNTSVRPVFVSRPYALSLGDESCLFSFSGENDGKKPIDIISLDESVQRAAT